MLVAMIVRSAFGVGRSLFNVMTPDSPGANVITSPETEIWMASRSVPAPLSARLVTVRVAALAEPAASNAQSENTEMRAFINEHREIEDCIRARRNSTVATIRTVPKFKLQIRIWSFIWRLRWR